MTGLRKVVMALLIAAIVFSLIMCTMQAVLFKNAYTNYSEGRVLRDGWQSVTARGVEPFTDFGKDISSSSLTLRIGLYDLNPGVDGAIAFYCNNSAVTASVDGSIIYTYGNIRDMREGMFLGNLYCVIPVPRSGALQLSFYNPSGSINVGEITLGTSCREMSDAASGSIGPLMLTTAGIVLTLVLIVIAVIGRSHHAVPRSQFYLMFFFIMLAVWAITDSQLPIFMKANTNGICLLSYELFTLVPVPFSLFLGEVIPKKKNWDYAAAFVSIVSFIALNILHFTGTAHFTETTAVTHIIMSLTLLLGLVQIIGRYVAKHDGSSRTLLLGYLFLILGGLGQLIGYHFADSNYNRVSIAVGVVLFAGTQFIYVVSEIFAAAEEGYRAQLYLEMATTDALTGLPNRRAMDDRLAALREGRIRTRRFACVSCDLDHLKEVNDTLGHSAGDEMIRGMASCLKEVFEDRGLVCRTGGDEFNILISDEGVDIDSAAAEVQECIDRYNETNEIKLGCSVGIAFEQMHGDINLLLRRVMHQAEERMYEEKRRHHEEG